MRRDSEPVQTSSTVAECFNCEARKHRESFVSAALQLPAVSAINCFSCWGRGTGLFGLFKLTSMLEAEREERAPCSASSRSLSVSSMKDRRDTAISSCTHINSQAHPLLQAGKKQRDSQNKVGLVLSFNLRLSICSLPLWTDKSL